MNSTTLPLNTSAEDSDSELSRSHQIIFICMWVVGMVLNTGCVPIVGCVLRNKPSWPTILLFVLTLSDAIVVVFGLTVGVAAAVDNSLLWEIGPLCTYQSIVINTWYLFSYVLVVAISMDRYVAVCHPFVYNKQMTGKASMTKGIVVLLLASVAMLLVSCLPLVVGADIVPVEPGIFCFFDWTSRTIPNKVVSIVNVGLTSLTLGVLLFFTVATCCGIYKMVQSARMRDGNVSLTQKASQSDSEMEVKFAKLMIVVIILFAACNLPFVVSIALETVLYSPSGSKLHVVHVLIFSSDCYCGSNGVGTPQL